MKNLLNSPKRKGYFFAAMSALAVSNVYILSKAALRETDLFVFGFFWFLSAFSYNLIYTISTKKFHLYFAYSKRQKLIPIFVTIMGIIFLKDKFNRVEVVGMALAIIGAVLVSYSGTFSLSGLFIYGSHFAILASLFASLGITLAKRQIKAYDPAILSFNRTIYLVGLFLILMLVYNKTFSISLQSFLFAALGSFAGPFIGAVLQYNSFKYIEASKTMIIQSTRSFIVLLISLIFFGLFPLIHQLIGGIIAIAGVIIIAAGTTNLKLK